VFCSSTSKTHPLEPQRSDESATVIVSGLESSEDEEETALDSTEELVLATQSFKYWPVVFPDPVRVTLLDCTPE
jgi:hypothetical protein